MPHHADVPAVFGGSQNDLVARFLDWAPAAAPEARAEGVAALARAFLYSDLSQSSREIVADVLALFTEDSSFRVRSSLAGALARSAEAPPAVIRALAYDVPDVALPVLVFSPLLHDVDLVQLVTTRGEQEQAAIAARNAVSQLVALALVEYGSARICMVLACNPEVGLEPGLLVRMLERHGTDADLRSRLLLRPELPAPLRYRLLCNIADELGSMASDRLGMDERRAEHMTQDGRERSALVVAEDAGTELAGLVSHLRDEGQLTTAIVLKALSEGNLAFVIAAFSELTGVTPARVGGLLKDPEAAAFRALHRQAGMPRSSLSVFQQALGAWAEAERQRLEGAHARQLVAERVLAATEGAAAGLFVQSGADASRQMSRARLRHHAPEHFARAA